MKRSSLLAVLCVMLVCAVCSAAFGAFKMNPARFADFCKTASAQEVRNVLDAGAEMDDEAWFKAAARNPDVEVLRVLLDEARKYGVNSLTREIDGMEPTLRH